MANKIAIRYDSLSTMISALRLGTSQKTKVYNESKTVSAKSLKFIFAHRAEAAMLPSYRKNSIFIISGTHHSDQFKTVFDGADNLSETPCTLDATANNAPSPQIITSSTSPDNSGWYAFNQRNDDVGWWGYPKVNNVHAIMVDRGIPVLVNKYMIYAGQGGGTWGAPISWEYQVSNDPTVTVNDSIRSSKWTVLDSRSNSMNLLKQFLTFVNGVYYRFHRFVITSSNSGSEVYIQEIILVSPIV